MIRSTKHAPIQPHYLFVILFCMTILAASALSARPDTPGKPDAVTIQLKWTHQFQFAGYYAALEKGFYAEEGLNIIIKERHKTKDPVDCVLDGEAEYGVYDTSLLLYRAEGKPVVLLAQIFQHSPHIFVSKKGSGIMSPYEMKGKKVMYPVKSRDNAPLLAMLTETLGDISQIISVPQSFNYEDFISGEVDVTTAYITIGPHYYRQRGIPVNIINPQSYGIDFYGDNLFTTEKEINKHPERVNKIIRATLRGWTYALEHKDEIIKIMFNKYYPKANRETLSFEANMTEMMILPDLIPMGEVNPNRYQRIADTYKRLGIMQENIVPEGFIYKKQREPEVVLTDKEKAWLHKHPDIVLGMGKDWAPYALMNQDGSISGIEADYVRLLNKKLGTRIRLTAGRWKEMVDKAKKGEIDGLACSAPLEARKPFFNFTSPYHTTRKLIFTLRDQAVDILGLEDLKGKSVGIQEGIAFDRQVLQQYEDIRIVECSDYEDIINRLIEHKIDAAMNSTGFQYHLIRNAVLGIKVAHVIEESKIDLVYSIRKDWPELIGILNKGIAGIIEEEHHQIRKRWLSEVEVSRKKTAQLTLEEHAWLEGHREIRLGPARRGRPMSFMIDPASIPEWCLILSVN